MAGGLGFILGLSLKSGLMSGAASRRSMYGLPLSSFAQFSAQIEVSCETKSLSEMVEGGGVTQLVSIVNLHSICMFIMILFAKAAS